MQEQAILIRTKLPLNCIGGRGSALWRRGCIPKHNSHLSELKVNMLYVKISFFKKGRIRMYL